MASASSSRELPKPPPPPASQVTLLVRDTVLFQKPHQISWLVSHLDQVVTSDTDAPPSGPSLFPASSPLSGQGPTDLSGALHTDPTSPTGLVSTPNVITASVLPSSPSIVTASTKTFFLSYTYRIVIAIDMSPSLTAMDPAGSSILFEHLSPILDRLFKALTTPVPLTLGGGTFTPHIYLTVIAMAPSLHPITPIIQGLLLTKDNIPDLAPALWKLESSMATESSLGAAHACVPSDMATLIQNGIYALNLLPDEALPYLLIITDGVVGLTDWRDYGAVFGQLNRYDVSVSVIPLLDQRFPVSSYGYIADLNTLAMLAHATAGSLMFPEQLTTPVIHRALLRRPISARRSGYHPQMPQSHSLGDYILSIDLLSLLQLRLREGFFLQSIKLKSSAVVFQLCLFWQPHVRVDVHITSRWPAPANLAVEISVQGSHAFITQLRKQPKSRSAAATLNSFLSGMRESERALIHLLKLTSDPDSSQESIERYLASLPEQQWYRALALEAFDVILLPDRPPDASAAASSAIAAASFSYAAPMAMVTAFLTEHWAPKQLGSSRHLRVLPNKAGLVIIHQTNINPALISFQLGYLCDQELVEADFKAFRQALMNLGCVYVASKEVRSFFVPQTSYTADISSSLILAESIDPTVRLSYPRFCRWDYALHSANIIPSILQSLVAARLREGFLPLEVVGEGVAWSFYKEIFVHIGKGVPPLSTYLQYTVHVPSDSFLAIKIRMEPQAATLTLANLGLADAEDLFSAIASRFAHIDGYILSALDSFETFHGSLGMPMLLSNHPDAGFQLVPLALEPLLDPGSEESLNFLTMATGSVASFAHYLPVLLWLTLRRVHDSEVSDWSDKPAFVSSVSSDELVVSFLYPKEMRVESYSVTRTGDYSARAAQRALDQAPIHSSVSRAFFSSNVTRASGEKKGTGHDTPVMEPAGAVASPVSSRGSRAVNGTSTSTSSLTNSATVTDTPGELTSVPETGSLHHNVYAAATTLHEFNFVTLVHAGLSLPTPNSVDEQDYQSALRICNQYMLGLDLSDFHSTAPTWHDPVGVPDSKVVSSQFRHVAGTTGDFVWGSRDSLPLIPSLDLENGLDSWVGAVKETPPWFLRIDLVQQKPNKRTTLSELSGLGIVKALKESSAEAGKTSLRIVSFVPPSTVQDRAAQPVIVIPSALEDRSADGRAAFEAVPDKYLDVLQGLLVEILTPIAELNLAYAASIASPWPRNLISRVVKHMDNLDGATTTLTLNFQHPDEAFPLFQQALEDVDWLANYGDVFVHEDHSHPLIVRLTSQSEVLLQAYLPQEEVVEQVKERLRAAERRVNQLTLLDELYSTRVTPEALDCERQTQLVIPVLTDRISVREASGVVVSRVLAHGAVTDNPALFVVKDASDGRVFYLSLEPEVDGSKDLVINVHGIDTPSSEITMQLRQVMMKNVIARTVAAIRVPLRPLDVAFLHNPWFESSQGPRPWSPPTLRIAWRIPPGLKSSETYASILHHNLLTWLRPLTRDKSSSSYVYAPDPRLRNETGRIGSGMVLAYMSLWDRDRVPVSGEFGTSANEFLDAVSSAPSSLNSSPTGVRKSSGGVPPRPPGSFPRAAASALLDQVSPLQDASAWPLHDPIQMNPEGKVETVVLNVWCAGAVDQASLKERFHVSFLHSVAEYVMERCVLGPELVVPAAGFAETWLGTANEVVATLESSTSDGAALATYPSETLVRTRWDVSLQWWAVPGLTGELRGALGASQAVLMVQPAPNQPTRLVRELEDVLVASDWRVFAVAGVTVSGLSNEVVVGQAQFTSLKRQSAAWLEVSPRIVSLVTYHWPERSTRATAVARIEAALQWAHTRGAVLINTLLLKAGCQPAITAQLRLALSLLGPRRASAALGLSQGESGTTSRSASSTPRLGTAPSEAAGALASLAASSGGPGLNQGRESGDARSATYGALARELQLREDLGRLRSVQPLGPVSGAYGPSAWLSELTASVAANDAGTVDSGVLVEMEAHGIASAARWIGPTDVFGVVPGAASAVLAHPQAPSSVGASVPRPKAVLSKSSEGVGGGEVSGDGPLEKTVVRGRAARFVDWLGLDMAMEGAQGDGDDVLDGGHASGARGEGMKAAADAAGAKGPKAGGVHPLHDARCSGDKQLRLAVSVPSLRAITLAPLWLHGEALRELRALRLSALLEKKSRLDVAAKWSRGANHANVPFGTRRTAVVDPSTHGKFMRNARLMYWVRAPMLVSVGRAESLVSLEGGVSVGGNRVPVPSALVSVLGMFRDEYVRFLERTAGLMHVHIMEAPGPRVTETPAGGGKRPSVASGPASGVQSGSQTPETSGATSSRMTILGLKKSRRPSALSALTMPKTRGDPASPTGPDNGLASLRTFLHKTLSGGVILVEVSFQDLFVCANMWTTPLDSWTTGVPREHEDYARECAQIQTALHLHSSTYDFMLRTLARVIKEPGSLGEAVSSTRGLVRVLDSVIGYFPVHPLYSLNDLVFQDVPIWLGFPVSPMHFFEYICRHASSSRSDRTAEQPVDPGFFCVMRLDPFFGGAGGGGVGGVGTLGGRRDSTGLGAASGKKSVYSLVIVPMVVSGSGGASLTLEEERNVFEGTTRVSRGTPIQNRGLTVVEAGSRMSRRRVRGLVLRFYMMQIHPDETFQPGGGASGGPDRTTNEAVASARGYVEGLVEQVQDPYRRDMVWEHLCPIRYEADAFFPPQDVAAETGARSRAQSRSRARVRGEPGPGLEPGLVEQRGVDAAEFEFLLEHTERSPLVTKAPELGSLLSLPGARWTDFLGHLVRTYEGFCYAKVTPGWSHVLVFTRINPHVFLHVRTPITRPGPGTHASLSVCVCHRDQRGDLLTRPELVERRNLWIDEAEARLVATFAGALSHWVWRGVVVN